MKTAKKFTLSTVALFALVSLAACSPKKPTAKDIEGVLLTNMKARYILYSDVKVSTLNCAESNKKFECVFNAHAKGTRPNMVGEWKPFDNEFNNQSIKVILGDAGWMEVMN